jgi:hypothetical protein
MIAFVSAKSPGHQSGGLPKPPKLSAKHLNPDGGLRSLHHHDHADPLTLASIGTIIPP